MERQGKMTLRLTKDKQTNKIKEQNKTKQNKTKHVSEIKYK